MTTSFLFLHLVAYDFVLIVQLEIRTLKISSAQKALHVILVQIHITDIALIIFVICIICTIITTCHIISPFKALSILYALCYKQVYKVCCISYQHNDSGRLAEFLVLAGRYKQERSCNNTYNSVKQKIPAIRNRCNQ